ncbi:MAG: TonB family protein [candidate division WOR-3 bacterium]
MKKLLTFGVIIVLLSCGPREEKLTGEPGGTLVIGTMEEPSSLVPLKPSVTGSNEIMDMLFLHLHRVDPGSGRIINQLATAWEYSEDLKMITYTLRKDVKWWDGKPVTAEDVLYAFEKMKDPKTGYPNITSIRNIEKAEVLGPHTIRFRFTKVYGDQLIDSDIQPVPKHILEKNPDLDKFGENPVGNGPFIVKRWIRGSSLELVANPEFYRGRPPLDQIRFIFYTDLEAMAKDFEDGKIDMITDVSPALAQRWQKNQNIVISSQPGSSYIYIGWNLRHPLLQNIEIRKALTMAIDVPKILKENFLDQGAIAVGPIPPSSWAYNNKIKPITYNPLVAQDILLKQGLTDVDRDKFLEKDGRPFELNLITNKENTLRVAIANQVASQLAKIGIRVKVQALDLNSFVNSILTGKFDGYIMGSRVSQKIDPSIYWYSDPQRGRYNLVVYKNRVVDSLIDEGLVALSRRRAKEIWDRFQEIIYESQPFTFLVIPNEISATYKRVRGIKESGPSIYESYAYWIPESERRPIAVAATTPPTPSPSPTPTTTVTTTTPIAPAEAPKPKTPTPPAPKPPQIVEPEKILEARAKAAETPPPETTKPVVTPPPMPKPVIETQAQIIKRVNAIYPEAAREFGAEGVVKVRVIVGADGKVKNATVVKSFGNALCEEAALRAAQQWEFKPATKDGVPVESPLTLEFTFKP